MDCVRSHASESVGLCDSLRIEMVSECSCLTPVVGSMRNIFFIIEGGFINRLMVAWRASLLRSKQNIKNPMHSQTKLISVVKGSAHSCSDLVEPTSQRTAQCLQVNVEATSAKLERK